MKEFRKVSLFLLAVLLVAGCMSGSKPSARQALAEVVPARLEAPSGSARQSALMTAEEAQAIALAHAGLDAERVRRLRAEYDVERGVPVYEVEFEEGRWEYEYEIHAETGEILSVEKDA